MLTPKQEKFRLAFLSPFKQRLYFAKNLPMALLSGTKLVSFSEQSAVATVPFKHLTKNPFNSTYFAVMSMAAELSTAAPAMLALKGSEADIALIIVDFLAEFLKKAQSKTTFVSHDFHKFQSAISNLKNPGDSASVSAKTIGTNSAGEEVACFYFTWSFKRRS